MSARKKSAQPPPPPKKMTKRQLSRHQREVRRQRYAYIFIGVALALIVLVPAFGYWKEVLSRGFEPVATVDGETITADTYARYLGLQEAIVQQQLQEVASSASTGGQNNTPQLAQIQMQILQQRLQTLPDSALSDMIEGKLVRDEAKRRGITATQDELDKQLQSAMSPNPFLSGVSIDQSNPAQISVDDARKQLQTILGKGRFLTEDEYRTYVLESDVLRTKLIDAMGQSLPKSGPQVHARHILISADSIAAPSATSTAGATPAAGATPTPAGTPTPFPTPITEPTAAAEATATADAKVLAMANAVKARLDKGEDFATVAKEVSADTSNKDKGGDLGWFPKGQMDPAFESAAFSLPVNQISSPVKTSYGYHIIQVLEKDDNRPYDASEIDQMKSKAYNDWLQAQRAPEANLVQETMTSDTYNWVSSTAETESAKVLK